MAYTQWVDIYERVRAGDSAGMEALYRQMSGARYHLYNRLGECDVEDHLHECFMAAVKAIQNGLRDPERLLGLLRTIIARHITEQYGRRDRERKRLLNLADFPRLTDPKENPLEALERRQTHNAMLSALLALKDTDREILIRYYLREQTQEEICEQMNLTPTQFRLNKSRAKARFGTTGREQLVLRCPANGVSMRRIVKPISLRSSGRARISRS